MNTLHNSSIRVFTLKLRGSSCSSPTTSSMQSARSLARRLCASRWIGMRRKCRWRSASCTMTDMRVTQHDRGKLQATEAFTHQGSSPDPLKPGLPQEPGFFLGACTLFQCSLGCVRAQALANPVCMCVALVLQTESACSDLGNELCRGRVRTQPREHCLVSSVDQSVGLRSRRPEVQLLHEAPVSTSVPLDFG